MPAYSDRSKAICLAALAEVRRVLDGCGVDFRVIGGSAVLEVMQARPTAATPVDYVGTLDVDLATPDWRSRRELERLLIRGGARRHATDPDRVLLSVTVEGDVVEAPVDLMTSSLFAAGAAGPSGSVLPLPALLLSKLRPYESKGEKDKDGYDAYMLLTHAAHDPEALAVECARDLPRDLALELLKLVEVFFLMKRKAARHASNIFAEYHGARRRDTQRLAVTAAERFVRTLRERLGA